MAVQTTKTNKPINPRGNDQSPKGYNRAALYSGKALDFDGVNDKVDLDGFTMAGDVATIVFQAKFENDNYFLDLNPQRFIIANRNSEGFRVFNANTWINYGTTDRSKIGFYAVVSDSTTQRVYYNGHQLGSDQTITALDWDSISNFKLGSGYDGLAAFLDGQIAGFKIFNTALTAAQVADLYNNPEKIVPTGVAESALKLWLPMMEGAGTTCYDGSGGGNHGTISGATWTHGIGAPVAQTAVIDWNKGTNILEYTENPDDNGNFLARGFTKNSSTETSPIGTNDAHKYTEDGTNGNPGLVWLTDYSDGNSQTFKVYLKADAATSIALATTGQTSGGNINVTTEWQQFEVTQSVDSTSGPHIGGFATITQGSGIVLYMWHPQMSYGDSVYIPTLATAQTSPVLLPQGLTSGRDITGVNLFENVRKQGALNLDGNSWAEVHDNGSVDLTTNFSLEIWCYPTEDGHVAGRELIGKFISSSAPFQCWVIEYQPNQFNFAIGATDNTFSGIASITGKTKENWYHVVATYDGATRKIYVNGVEEGSGAFTKTPQTTDKNIAIGRWLGQAVGGTNTFIGPIAQPRIYNRALTAEEVERNYNAGKNIYK